MLALMCIVLLGSYSVSVAVLDEVGTKSSSTHYEVWGAGCQSSIIGGGTSTAYRARYGFFGHFAERELGVEEHQTEPLVTALKGTRPNPANGPVHINYTLASNGFASLKIYDITGRLVKVLLNGRIRAGKYELRWDCTSKHNKLVPAGVYFYRFVVDGKPIATKKLVLVR